MVIQRLIKKEISLSYVIYRVFRANRMTRKIVNVFYNVFVRRLKNTISNDIELIPIKTYDGFDQCTHPDIVLHNNNVYLVITPYPYSDERYENPSMYIGNRDFVFSPAALNPIVRFDIRPFRHHFSDPALLLREDSLFVFYRDSVHTDNIRIDYIFRGVFENKRLINSVKIDFGFNHCLSPSFTCVGERTIVFFVSDESQNTVLYMGELVGESVRDIRTTKIYGYSSEMKIWHVDVKYRNNQFEGLFTFMEEPGAGCTRLYLAKSTDGIEWFILEEISFGEKTNVKNLYKATSFSDEGKTHALISALDSHGRWLVYVKKDVSWK